MGLPQENIWHLKLRDATGFARSNSNDMKLIFATNNQHKIDEVRPLLMNSSIELITLGEAGIDIEIPEPFNSLEENASHKSKTIYELTGTNCFSEDTGLEVPALGGAPGVKSARYAGEERSFERNIAKLLKELEASPDRSARFRTAISLLLDGKEHQFEGICEGTIISEARGIEGFGYDPVFVPHGSNYSFAEMELAEKNQFSHRKKAIEKLVNFLNSQTVQI